jgi:hypothetical protein
MNMSKVIEHVVKFKLLTMLCLTSTSGYPQPQREPLA